MDVGRAAIKSLRIQEPEPRRRSHTAHLEAGHRGSTLLVHEKERDATSLCWLSFSWLHLRRGDTWLFSCKRAKREEDAPCKWTVQEADKPAWRSAPCRLFTGLTLAEPVCIETVSRPPTRTESPSGVATIHAQPDCQQCREVLKGVVSPAFE